MSIETTYIHFDHMTIGIRHDNMLDKILTDLDQANKIASDNSYQFTPLHSIFLNLVTKNADPHAWKRFYDKVWISNIRKEHTISKDADCFQIEVQHDYNVVFHFKHYEKITESPIDYITTTVCEHCGRPYEGEVVSGLGTEYFYKCEHCGHCDGKTYDTSK